MKTVNDETPLLGGRPLLRKNILCLAALFSLIITCTTGLLTALVDLVVYGLLHHIKCPSSASTQQDCDTFLLPACVWCAELSECVNKNCDRNTTDPFCPELFPDCPIDWEAEITSDAVVLSIAGAGTLIFAICAGYCIFRDPGIPIYLSLAIATIYSFVFTWFISTIQSVFQKEDLVHNYSLLVMGFIFIKDGLKVLGEGLESNRALPTIAFCVFMLSAQIAANIDTSDERLVLYINLMTIIILITEVWCTWWHIKKYWRKAAYLVWMLLLLGSSLTSAVLAFSHHSIAEQIHFVVAIGLLLQDVVIEHQMKIFKILKKYNGVSL